MNMKKWMPVLILALLMPLMIQAQSVSKQFVIDIPHGNDTTSLYVFLPDEQVATGRAVLDDGTVLTFEDFFGFAEKVRNRW